MDNKTARKWADEIGEQYGLNALQSRSLVRWIDAAIREACKPLVEAVLNRENRRINEAMLPWFPNCLTCGHINPDHTEDCEYGKIVRLAKELKGENQ